MNAILAATAGMDPMMVGTMIGGMLLTLIGGGVVGKKIADSSRVKIDNQPLEISLAEQYVRREEFAEFKGEMKADIREMRGLFDKAVTLIKERDERLTENIHSVASGAYEGRRRLHDKVNDHSNKLASIEVKTDVSKAIGKLGGAIITAMKGDQHPEH